MNRSKTVLLSSQPYLDLHNQCYKNIVVTNLLPQGPLCELVTRIHFPPLSQFKQPGPCSRINNCGLALSQLNGFFYNNMAILWQQYCKVLGSRVLNYYYC